MADMGFLTQMLGMNSGSGMGGMFDKWGEIDPLGRLVTGQGNKEIDRALGDLRNTSGQPGRTPFLSAIGQNGNILPQYEMQASKPLEWQDAKVNTQGLEALRQRALSQGPSAWAGLAEQQQGLQAREGRQRAEQEGASQAAQAQSQLAMRGGLSGGAAERLAGQSARDIAMRRHGINRQAMNNRLGISMQDEQNKLGLLSQLPGQELGYGQFDLANKQGAVNVAGQNRNAEMQRNQFNIANTLGQMQNQNAYNADLYRSEMGAWGAGKQAEATLNSGRPKGLLGK